MKLFNAVALASSLAFISAGAAQAAVTIIPNSSLTPSTTYYTDSIGGGIGATGAVAICDDCSSALIPLGFSLNLFGVSYNSLYINNNGNVSFTTPLSQYTPTGPQGISGTSVISPFFADVDTRSIGTVNVRSDIANEIIITWNNVGYYAGETALTNSFQLVLRGTQFAIPTGEGAIGFFYEQMQWETGNASGGSGGFGGSPAAVGFGDGLLNGEIIQGSQTNGIAAILADSHIWFDQNLVVVPPPPPVTPPTTGVPEPESIALLGLGLVGVGVARRRKQA